MKTNMISMSITGILLFVYLGSLLNGERTSMLKSPELTGDYFGQQLPNEKPEIFAPGIISTESVEYGGTFSPDGEEFFFTRKNMENKTNNRIFFSKRTNGTWSEPRPTSISNNHSEFEPHISPNGKILYFASTRKKPISFRRKGEIWKVEKKDSGWTKPVYLKSVINNYFGRSVTSTTDGTLYFTAYVNNIYGIYRSKNINNIQQEPELLPLEINYLVGLTHPFISPDEKFLLFESYQEGSNCSCLYISFRNEQGDWSLAEKLGPKINATATETCPSISPDGKFLFFSREGNIYWVSTDVIKKSENSDFL
ncbi:MAG: hypothetical protein U9N53_03400 [Bacteroidota bacterium]|nr:hypothetical protein [Bacteroidota bacterium]